ncbi:MAG: porin [Burkholderiales bacterium]|nr:porin [Burkholderiales bacterium]
MNKQLLAAGLSAACVAAAAQSSVTVGGTIDLAARQVRNGSLGSIKSEVSGANSTSKLVLRGVEDLGGGVSAGFFLDATILADTGAAGATAQPGPFWDRRSTVSLADVSLGELRAGRDWVPTHLVWSGFDPFFTLGIAGANTFRSFAASRALGQAFGTAGEATTANPTLRVSNALEYFLPAGLAGVYGQLIVTAAEGGTTATGGTRGQGFRLGWARGPWNIAAAQFITRNASGNHAFTDQSYGASYDFGVVKLDVAQRRWLFGVDRTVNTQVGAVIPVGAGAIKLTYVRADQTGATAASSANDATLLGAGYQYNLSRRTALYAHLSRVANQGAATFAILGGPAVSATPSAPNYFGGQKSTAYEFGLRHDF